MARGSWARIALVGLLVTVAPAACDDGPSSVRYRTDWWLSAAPEGDVLDIVVYRGSSSCTAYDGVVVDEQADVVTIEAFVRIRTGVKECTTDWVTESETIRLDAPLGDRRLDGCVAPADGHKAAVDDDLGTSCRARIGDTSGQPTT